MDVKLFHRRVWSLVLVMVILLTCLGSTLYDVQINSGEEYLQQSNRRTPKTETVEAGRGQLLDRNGKLLVSDSPIYEVTLDTSSMGTAEEKAQTILKLLEVCRDSGLTWTDTLLPISREQPFTFTTDSPYYTTEADDSGNEVKTLTMFGKLVVEKLRLVDDPTAPPEEEEEPEEPEEPSLLDRIKQFLKGGPEEEPEPVEPEAPFDYTDATAILGKLCAYFKIHGEGAVDEKDAKENGRKVPVLNIGRISPEEAREACGILYELEVRAQDLRRVSYTFTKGVDIDFITRVKELGLDGVVINATTVRQYHTTYAAHILGRVGAMRTQDEIDYYTGLDEDGDGEPDYQMDDKIGLEGAEKAFESYLRGRPGKRSVETSDGKVVSTSWIKEPEPGANVMLTLDLDLQMAVEHILASGIAKLASTEVQGGGAVVMDVATSEVLAAASYPTYSLITYSEDFAENSANPLKPFTNRAFNGAYPPGSTFKMVTAVAGLEEGIIGPYTQIRDLGVYDYYKGYPQKCWIYRQGGGTHGLQNVSQAITNSCNYFFYDVGRQLGIQRLSDYAHKFGIGEYTGLELSESKGVMAGPEYTESLGGTWYEGSTLSVAIGQESTQISLVQLCNYVCTLLNGGKRNAAHLLKTVKSSDYSKVILDKEPELLSEFSIAPENLDAVKRGMLGVANVTMRGTFDNLGFQVGAKTGSAQISADTESNSIFVIFAPYENPEIAVAIVVEHGGSGSTLGNMADEILDYYFNTADAAENVTVENTMIP